MEKQRLSQYIAAVPGFEKASFDSDLSITVIPDVLLLQRISCQLGDEDETVDAEAFTITLTVEAILFKTPVTASAALLIVGNIPQSVELSLHTGTVSLSNGLSDLMHLVSPDAGFTVPDYFPKLEATLSNLKAYISLSGAKKLISLGGGLYLTFNAEQGGWSPIPDTEDIGINLSDLIKIQTLAIAFEWDSLMGVQWAVNGQTSIANSYNLSASYSHPQKRIYAHLYPAEGAKDTFQSFLQDKLGIDASISNILATPLSSADLVIDADIRNKNFLFKLTNYHDDPWHFAHVLQVKHMEFRIFFLQGKFSIAELYLDLTLPIGKVQDGTREDVVLNLEGTFERDGEQKNWFFEAEIDDPVAVGDFIAGLAEKFGASADSVPDQIKELLFEDLYLAFNHEDDATQFIFSGSLSFPIGNQPFTLHIEVQVGKSNGKWEIHLSTSINIAGYTLSVDFDSNDTGKFLIASLSSNAKINIAELLHEIAPGEIDSFIPESLELGLQNAFIAFYFPKDAKDASENDTAIQKAPNKATVVFGLGLDMDVQIDFGGIPGIGPLIGGVAISLNKMRVVGSTVDINAGTLAVIDAKLSDKNILGLADTQQKAIPANTGTNSTVAFSKGVALEAELELPGLVVRLAHSFGEKPDQSSKEDNNKKRENEKSSAQPSETTAVVPQPSQNRMLSPVGQKVGPFFIESVGLGVKEGRFGINFTGGITVGPLVLELLDFSVSSPIEKFSPSFDLRALAIGYDKAPLTISGILLKSEGEYTDNQGLIVKTFGFKGGISIGFNQVSIAMLGAYDHAKKYKDNKLVSSFHSLFVYGYLGAPLGGPPFLFVTGLALGIGFNRGLNMPEPTEFGVFPLTAAALKPSGAALTVDDLTAMMTSLDQYIPIKEGAFWLAVGVKFESFKFLSGFLMLAVKFDEELEIDILGIIDANINAGTTTVARLSIGFTVRFLPQSGVLEAKGAFLPSTFIFHESVKIEGGMAMLAIFKDQTKGEWKDAKAGEFVLTLGGYGPLYKPKPYYPTVPPLQLSWKVNDNLQISASAYFAVTPEAIMLGAVIRGIFKYVSDNITIDAHFTVEAHFLIYWQPVRYIGKASAEFNLSGKVEALFLSVDVNMDASASLEIYGPEFSGKANLSLHFVVSFSVEVKFGAAENTIKPIGWDEFKSSLLPPKEKVVTLNISNGILPESIGGINNYVNPLDFRVTIDLQIPVKKTYLDNGLYIEGDRALGIKPMAVTNSDFVSDLNIIVKSNENEDVTSKFNVVPIYKNIPSAIWTPARIGGQIPEKSVDESLIQDVICGFELSSPKIEIVDFIEIDSNNAKHHLDGNTNVIKIKSTEYNDYSLDATKISTTQVQDLIDIFYEN